MADQQIVKTYELRSIGGDSVLQDLVAINRQFVEIRKNKVALNEARTRPVEDPAELAEISRKLGEIKVKEAELALELKKKQVLIKEQQLANAMQSQALTEEKGKIAEVALSLKQLQLQRQQETLAARQAASGNEALAGSYNDVAKKYRDLLAIAKNTTPIGDPAKVAEAATELQRLKTQLDAFNRSLTADGTLVGEYSTGILNAFKRLGLGDLIRGQADQAKAALLTLNQQFDALKAELLSIRQAGQGGLGAVEAQLIQNRNAAAQLENKLAEINATLASSGNIGTTVLAGFKNELANLKGQFTSFLVGYLGFQQAIRAVTGTIHLNEEISDALAQLQIYLHGDKEAADQLFDSLKKLDTRTLLPELLDIATIVAKKGVAKEEITGVTQAIDQLLVTLGKEIGDPHEAVSSLVKLVNVYSDDHHVTAKNISDIGAAIQKLTSSGVASGSFLINFAERLAGIRGITGVSIQNILGLGAALQELGQRSETAGTAASQLIVKMFGDIPKYAGFAGKSVDEFTRTITANPVEALIELAQGLKTNKEGLAEVAQAFDAAGIHGARVVGVLGDIAGNADYMRKRVKDANAAFGDQASILAANEIKQHTFAATLDRITKKFQEIGSNRGVQAVLVAIAAIITLLIGNLGTIIGLLAVYALGWLGVTREITVAGEVMSVTNARMVLLNIQILASRIALGLLNVVTAAVNVVTRAYAVTLGLLTGTMTASSAAVVSLSATLRAMPWGWLLVIIGAVVAALTALSVTAFAGTGRLRDHSLALSANVEVMAAAQKAIAETTSKISVYANVLKDATLDVDTHRFALQELIKINPKFQEALEGNTINMKKFQEILAQVNADLVKNAELQAAQSRLTEESQKLSTLQSLRIKLNVLNSQEDGIHRSDFTDQERELLDVGPMGYIRALFNVRFNNQDTREIFKDLDARIEQQKKQVKAYLDVATKKATELPQGEAPPASATPLGRSINQIQAELDVATKNFKAADVYSKEYYEWQKKIKELQDELDKANPAKVGKFVGSRITGEQKDAIRDIDAFRDESLAKEQQRYLEQKRLRDLTVEEEARHLQRILSINVSAADKKIAALKGSNAIERKDIAELRLYRVDQQQKTNADTYKLYQQDLENQKAALEHEAAARRDAVTGDASSSSLSKAAAEANFLQDMLAIQKAYNTAADGLEKTYGLRSVENENARNKALADARRAANAGLLEANKRSAENEIQEVQAALQDRLEGIYDQFYKQAQKAFESNNTVQGKQAAIQKLEAAARRDAARATIDATTQELATYQYLLDNKLISQLEYNKQAAKLAEQRHQAEVALINAEVDAHRKKQKLINDVEETAARIGRAYVTAFVDDQNRKIQATFDEAQAVRDAERQKLLDQASSDEERTAINATFDAKNKEAARQKNLEEKEVKKKQLYLELALASARAISNALTIPGAGIIDALIAEGLVVAEFLANLSILDNQQFAMGGAMTTSRVLAGGGIFSGPSHAGGGIRFLFGGAPKEVEGREGYVIRAASMESARPITVTGTPAQIASAANTVGGGVNFAPGAFIRPMAYGGILGAGLAAPIFTPSAGGSAGIDALGDQIRGLYLSLLETNRTIYRMQVVLAPGDVQEANDKRNKAVKLGTL